VVTFVQLGVTGADHWVDERTIMGHFHYDGHEFIIDDRILAHIQTVVSAKLRRGENFFFNWSAGIEHGGGHEAIWIDNGIPLRFAYAGGHQPALNREWVEALAASANSTSGLRMTAEPLVHA
jgi:hypothetical protein